MKSMSRSRVTRRVAVMILVGSLTAGGSPVTRAPAQGAIGSRHSDGRYMIRSGSPLLPELSSFAPYLASGQAKRQALAPRAAQTSGAVQSSAQLELPASAFPAGFLVLESSAMSAADLDGTAFRQLHAHSYSSLAAMGGWWHYYGAALGDGVFDVVYQGSFYPTSDAARAAFADIRSNVSPAGPLPCSFGDRCFQLTATILFPDGEYRGPLRVVQSSNALAEMQADVPDADYSPLQAQLTSALDGVSTSFVRIAGTAAMPTSTPTAIPTMVPTSTPSPTVVPSPTATSTPAPTATATAIPTSPGLKVTVSGVPHAGHVATLRVAVTNRAVGEPVPGARVTVNGRAVGIPSRLHATTNGSGKATFAGVRPTRSGKLTVRATKSGYTPTTVHAAVRG